MAQAKTPPGVMLYFGIRPCPKRLTLEEKGRLFEAILDYGERGMLPNFDGAVGVAWDFVQPQIDADRAAYTEKCAKAKKAVETRWAKASGDSTKEYGRIPSNTYDF